ncbi:MAG: hypothetical protein ACM3JD_02455 [Rudaea sp.]
MTEEVRVAVLENRINRLERDRIGDEKRVQVLEDKLDLLRTNFEVLQARVTIYAAMGAVAGGALFSVAADVIRAYLAIH